MANLAKTEGTNVDAYLFKVLRDSGFSPTKDVNGVPAQIMRALIVGNGGKIKEDAKPQGLIKGNLSDQPIGAPVRTNQ
jgi:hypothetical protein